MSVTLESLEMTPQEQETCKEAVRRIAYCKWLDAGCPATGEVDFWLQAQREWIARHYVPNRTFEGARPESNEEPSALPGSDMCHEVSANESRPRARAKAGV